MSTGLLALLAFSPIVLAAILLAGLRWPAKHAMPWVNVLTACVGLFAGDMRANRVLASTLQGLLITLGLLWMIFADLAFTIPYALTGVFLGAKFPTLASGLIGLAIVTSAVRMGFLLPKPTWNFAQRVDSRANGWALSR